MKKIMVSAVMLLPMFVMMILLASGAMISNMTHVYVDRIEITETGTIKLQMTDESNPPEHKLQVRVYPLSAKNNGLKFSSSDESVCTVDENGMIRAVDFGEAYVTVESVENKSATATRKVLVYDTVAHRIEFKTQPPAKLYVGQTFQFSAKIYPEQAENKSIKWTSSADEIMSVSENGILTPLGAGEVTIKATAEGNPKVVKTVKITSAVPLENLSFENSSDGQTTITSASEMDFPTIKKEPIETDAKIRYTSSDETVAMVSSMGHITFLGAGSVQISAIAEDDIGNSAIISKTYVSTNGYYMGNLFSDASIEINFDDCMADGALLPIDIVSNPEGADMQIIDVTYSVPDLIRFDYATKKFYLTGTEPTSDFSIVITIKAQKYNSETNQIEEFEDDKCIVYITRDVSEISFAENNISTQSKTVYVASQNMTVSPKFHTDTVEYEIESGEEYVSSFDEASGKLVFSQTGVVKVVVNAKDKANTVVATNYIIISYTAISKGDKVLTFDSKESESKSFTLSASTDSAGSVEFIPPENTRKIVSYDITEGEGIVEIEYESGTPKIKPLKGGYATITVTVEVETVEAARVTAYANSTVIKTFTMRIYVDKEVENLEFVFDDSIDSLSKTSSLTSKQAVDFKVKVSPVDAMEGKLLKLKLDIGYTLEVLTEESRDETYIYYSYSATFDRALQTKKFTATVWYEEEFDGKATGDEVSHSIMSTYGNLYEDPEVVQDSDTEILGNKTVNEIVFSDIGEEHIISIDTLGAKPKDFVFRKSDVAVSSSALIATIISDDGKTVTLKALSVGTEQITLTIAGRTFILKLTINAKSQKLDVKTNGKILPASYYVAVVDSLKFNVSLGRTTDGFSVSDGTVIWKYGSQSGTVDTLLNGDFTIALEEGETMLEISARDGGANKQTFYITKVTDFYKEDGDELGVDVSYTDSFNVEQTLDSILLKKDSKELFYTVPRNMNDVITLKFTIPSNLVGGFGEGETAQALFEKLFKVTGAEVGENAWTISYSYLTCSVYLRIKEGVSEQNITICHGENVRQQIKFFRIDITNIESYGFDMNISEDKYLGYQQVRLFAKNSYYNGASVDYYEIPFEVTGTLDYVQIILSRYVGNAMDRVLSKQIGNEVTTFAADGTEMTYTIDGGKLKDFDGNIVEGGKIAWVDLFSKPGYARIHFGEFEGLEETDVQNDFFGDFGEQGDGWKKQENVVDDDSGRVFTPSANAYSFLRFEANDGTANPEVSWHYNFNVLNQTDAVNIFDANGYYNNKKVVLHTDLYGPGELGEGVTNERFLSDAGKTSATKDLIYGNGHQVNLQSRNANLIATMEEKNLGNSGGASFGNIYNATIRGSNPTDTIAKTSQAVVLTIRYAYYCDLQYYAKISPSGAQGSQISYFKNTVLRCASKTAFQFYYDNTKAYFENLVEIECLGGISMESGNNTECYLKGYIDAINYYNKSGLLNAVSIPDILKNTAESYVMDKIDSYVEWFGKNDIASDDDGRLANVFMFMKGDKVPYIWDGSAYTQNGMVDGNIPVTEALNVKKILEGIPLIGSILNKAGTDLGSLDFRAWTYDVTYDVDGGSHGKEWVKHDGSWVPKYEEVYKHDMSKLYTEDRYIRLLCEYTHIDKDGTLHKNTDHLLWHTYRVYRDYSVINGGWSLDDHISNLQESIAKANVNWQ